MNKHGIFIQDIYLLSYCGIKVIFEVCETFEHSVRIIELATKKYRNGISLTKRIRPTRFPLVVTGPNTFEKSRYEVRTRPDKRLEIVITRASRLFWEATKYVECPLIGKFLAIPFPNYRDTFWNKPKKYKKDIDRFYLIN